MKTCCFFGHSVLMNYEANFISTKLKYLISELLKQGYVRFIIGSHGAFDKLVLSMCLHFKRLGCVMEINVVKTSKGFLKHQEYEVNLLYVFFLYEIESQHYKNTITYSNKCMIKDSDLIVFYINKNRAYTRVENFFNYSKSLNKSTINLFDS